MPSLVANVKINTVTGILNVGDSPFLVPKSTSTSKAGSGTFLTGDFPISINLISSTNTIEPHGTDGNITATL